MTMVRGAAEKDGPPHRLYDLERLWVLRFRVDDVNTPPSLEKKPAKLDAPVRR